MLLLMYTLNYLDRYLLTILLEPIKQELGVSDTAMGFLSGFAFVVFYTLAGIPIARWADRGSRRSIIALGLAVWSAMTVACGLAQSFVQLALARLGVGTGEAAGTPPSHSMISDYFPPERRATALSIYAQGIYIGAMIAYLAGGAIREAFDWRVAFFVVGTPGIALALLVRLTVREPTRGYWETTQPREAESFSTVLRLLFSSRAFRWLLAAACCQALSGYGFLSWGPTFLHRVHEMSFVDIGIWLGLIIGIAGSAGAYLGGIVSDKLGAGDERWYVWLSAIVSAIGVPFAMGFLLLDAQLAALLCFIPFYFVSAMYVGPMWSMVQSLVKPNMRATASAILLFILNIVGLGAGPQLVGILNDGLAESQGPFAIRYSLLAVAMVGGLAAIFFAGSAKTLREELRAAAE